MSSSRSEVLRKLTRFGITGVAAALALSSPAHASCRFPEGSTDTPNGVAKLLLDDSEALGFAVVKQTQKASLKRAEEIEMMFVLKGPQGTLRLRNPFSGTTIAVTNAQTTFQSPAGSIVFAALKRTQSGWVIGECTAQLLTAYPMTVLIPELQREFLNQRR